MDLERISAPTGVSAWVTAFSGFIAIIVSEYASLLFGFTWICWYFRQFVWNLLNLQGSAALGGKMQDL